jgi:hypothetical protein
MGMINAKLEKRLTFGNETKNGEETRNRSESESRTNFHLTV